MESNSFIDGIKWVLGFAGGGLGMYILQVFFGRKKNKADITDVNIKTALSLQESLNEQLLKEADNNKIIREELKKAHSEILEAQKRILKAELEMDRKDKLIELLIKTLKDNNIKIPEL